MRVHPNSASQSYCLFAFVAFCLFYKGVILRDIFHNYNRIVMAVFGDTTTVRGEIERYLVLVT